MNVQVIAIIFNSEWVHAFIFLSRIGTISNIKGATFLGNVSLRVTLIMMHFLSLLEERHVT